MDSTPYNLLERKNNLPLSTAEASAAVFRFVVNLSELTKNPSINDEDLL